MAAVKDLAIEIAEDYQKKNPGTTWKEAMLYASKMSKEDIVKWVKK